MNARATVRRLAADEDGCRERAQKAERGDELRVPTDRDIARAGADSRRRRRKARRLWPTTSCTAVAYVREAYSAGERRRDGDDRGVGLAAPLVQKEAGCEQHRRAGERERDARLDADPAAVDGDDEEENDADDDREPAEPREDPSAEQVLERLSSGRPESPCARARGSGVRRCLGASALE